MAKVSDGTGRGSKTASSRAERLAAELRANLRKRKSAARARTPSQPGATGELGRDPEREDGNDSRR